MKKIRVLKIDILCMGFLLLGCGLYAEYDRERCFSDITTVSFNELHSPQFKQLKDSVTTYLRHSWCSEEKIQLLMELTLLTKPQVSVEVGVFTGSSLLPVAATLKYLGKGKVYAIDAWSTETVLKNMSKDDPNKDWWSKINMQSVFMQFHRMKTQWSLSSFCTSIRAPSDQAVSKIPDHIDFLHLDGDYTERGSMNDVQLYLPKVKSGGYILISHLFTMVNGKAPKLPSYLQLLTQCIPIAGVDNDNAVLFKKP